MRIFLQAGVRANPREEYYVSDIEMGLSYPDNGHPTLVLRSRTGVEYKFRVEDLSPCNKRCMGKW